MAVELIKKDRKILFLVDNCSVFTYMDSKQIKIVFTSKHDSVLQLVEQSIINSLSNSVESERENEIKIKFIQCSVPSCQSIRLSCTFNCKTY